MISMSDFERDVVAFLLSDSDRRSQIQTLLSKEMSPAAEAHVGMPVSLTEIVCELPEIGAYLLKEPRRWLEGMDAALVTAQHQMLEHHNTDGVVKEYAHARIYGPPGLLHGCEKPVCSDTVDSLVTMTGTVAKTGVVHVLECRKLYECQTCGFTFAVAIDDVNVEVTLPTVCPKDVATPCDGRVFRQIKESFGFTNYQEIQVQEGNIASLGSSSKAVTVILQDDLADSCHIGEVVHITGVVVRHATSTSVGQKAFVHLALKAVSLVKDTFLGLSRENFMHIGEDSRGDLFARFWEVHAGQRFGARDRIITSVCPLLAGMYGVKLSVLLMLIGGTQLDEDKDELNAVKSRKRSEIHFLLVGDPGTGKSQIQSYVSKLAPRSVLTSGTSSSSAGLTAAAVKESGQWTLEAGALVLANGGVCCIDEIDGLKPSESSALHEAMEQQTCSVAKAGMVSTLQTKASVFGTCNTKGNRRIDPRRPLAEQLDMPSPLLSRFDIIMQLMDDMNPTTDSIVVDHVLNMRGHGSIDGTHDKAKHTDLMHHLWDDEMLRSYIQWCKQTFLPSLNKASENALTSYYQLRRLGGSDHVTVRFLESLIRISQAHARLMAKHTVELEDAAVAICLSDASNGMLDAGILQIPPHLRIWDAGYGLNNDPPDVKARQLVELVCESLDIQVSQ